MSLKDLLGFELIHTSTYSLSVYHVLLTLIVLISTWIIIGILRKFFHRQEEKKRIEVSTGHTIFLILRYIIWIAAVIVSLGTLQIKTTLLVAGSAALLVGLGLGLQQIFQDFISGIAIIIEGTLKVGDVVQTQDGEVSRVKEISMRTSKLETRDNIILIVPNSKLINDIVINWSHVEKKTRFRVEVGVAYGSDVTLVKEILQDCAARHKAIVNDPKPFVRFTNFGNSSFDFQLLFYTNETFRVEDIKSDLRYMIDAEFREKNIRIPFPQRDVHMYKMEED